MRELISTLKKRALAGIEWSNLLPKILANEETATNTTTTMPAEKSGNKRTRENVSLTGISNPKGYTFEAEFLSTVMEQLQWKLDPR